MPTITPAVLIAIIAIASKVLQYTVNLVILAWAGHPHWLDVLKVILDDLNPNPTLPTLRKPKLVVGTPVVVAK